MDFYKEWEECVSQGIDDSFYINSFLYRSSYSIDSLEKSSKKDIERIIRFLNMYDRRKIIERIDMQHVKCIVPSDVLQFSDFEKSTSDITHILKYETSGLTFEELGYLLGQSSTKLAATKYGENQAKTAKIFNLVKFSEDRPVEVKNTSLGNEFPFLDCITQKNLLSILGLRDPLVICLIAKAKEGHANYGEIASCLSETTLDRRRTNVKLLIEIVLYNIENDLIQKIKL